MKATFVTILFTSIIFGLQAQAVNDSCLTEMQRNSDIDKFIPTVKNKKHRAFLENFAKDRDSLTQMSVRHETKIRYEIWVDYSTSDGYNWGEGYTLNKRDGKIEMIWHEQPFKSEPLVLDSIPKKEN